MGTPMAVNYANLFLDKFETEMLDEYEKDHKLRPMLWLRYIDDIFFIWQHDEKSLKHFIKFCDNFSSSRKMKSKIKFETNMSETNVNFLDVTVSIKDNKLVTSLYTKPTDSHLYLNSKSCHPDHVIKNMPKGQFIRIKRICSEDKDFDHHARQMKAQFMARGYNKSNLEKTIREVQQLKRGDLLEEKNTVKEKDAQSVFVCTWHPKLSKLPSILKENHNILTADAKLSKTFPTRSTVGFRRKKNLSNYLCRTDIKMKATAEEGKCKGCILCKQMRAEKTVTNTNTGTSVKTKPGATCKTKGVIYAINCKKCNYMYVGHTGDSMAERFSKHKYDIKNRPQQNELAEHKGHNIEKDLDIFILDHGIPDLKRREFLEDKFICKLQTMPPHGLNTKIGSYAKEMYRCWSKALGVK